MNKTELLNKFSKDADERVVLARALDQMERFDARSIWSRARASTMRSSASLENLLSSSVLFIRYTTRFCAL